MSSSSRHGAAAGMAIARATRPPGVGPGRARDVEQDQTATTRHSNGFAETRHQHTEFARGEATSNAALALREAQERDVREWGQLMTHRVGAGHDHGQNVVTGVNRSCRRARARSSIECKMAAIARRRQGEAGCRDRLVQGWAQAPPRPGGVDQPDAASTRPARWGGSAVTR